MAALQLEVHHGQIADRARRAEERPLAVARFRDLAAGRGRGDGRDLGEIDGVPGRRRQHRVAVAVDVDRLEQEGDGAFVLLGRLERQRDGALLLVELQIRLFRAGKGRPGAALVGVERPGRRVGAGVAHGGGLDLVERVDELHRDFHLGRAVGDLDDVKAEGRDAAVEHLGQLARRDGHADAGAADLGHGDADETALVIDNRAAAVAGVEVAVDLDDAHVAAVVLADAGDRPLADGDGGVALGNRQRLAEREAERVDGHRFDDVHLLRQVERRGQVLGDNLEDGQVAVGVGGQYFRGIGLLLLAAAVEDEGDRRSPEMQVGGRRDDVVVRDDVADVAVHLHEESGAGGAAARRLDLDENGGGLEGRERVARDSLVRPNRSGDTGDKGRPDEQSAHGSIPHGADKDAASGEPASGVVLRLPIENGPVNRPVWRWSHWLVLRQSSLDR